jgi:hypothetical protein
MSEGAVTSESKVRTNPSSRLPSEVGKGFFGQFFPPAEPKAQATHVYLAPQVFIPFIISLASLSMTGVSIAAAQKAPLEGLFAEYPDFASKNFQDVMRNGEFIAAGMVIAAITLLVISYRNYKNVLEEEPIKYAVKV